MAHTLSVRIKGVTFTAESPEFLRDQVRAWIDSHGYGVSDIGAKWRIRGGHGLYAITYNGRLWRESGAEWTR